MSFKPGYIYPERTWPIISFINKVHFSFHNFFPDYNHWIFGEIFGDCQSGVIRSKELANAPREYYLVINEISKNRNGKLAVLFQSRKITYLKIMNSNHIRGVDIGKLSQNSQRICLKNVVVADISKDVLYSECKYITMKAVSNVQNLEHCKLFECEQANLLRTEMMKENLKIFSSKLKALTIRRTFSVDNIFCKYLAQRSPFKNLKVLDLGYNQIEWTGFVFLIEEGCVFCQSLRHLLLEHNIIITNMQDLISRLQLVKLERLDLNLNQIDWTEEWIRRQGFKIVQTYREKKFVQDREVKVKSFDIEIDETLKIKVMCNDQMYSG